MTRQVRTRKGGDTPSDVATAAAIVGLSGGNVVRVLPAGPVFGATRRRRATLPRTFVPRLSALDRAVVAVLTAGWIVCLVSFWIWWLEPAHRFGWVGVVLNSLLLLYLSVTPAYYLLTVNRLRHVDPAIDVPPLRVALVVTRAPSEPWPVARATLEAMAAQDYPHAYDVWLCDEDPSEEVRRWCADHGVKVSTRHGVSEYHRTSWPRRTRCKEGNLAYFYDRWGYKHYDVVAQLDCDHVPGPGYLAAMVRPFADPAIGYVAAPSVCDANAGQSWAARGRLHREASWHGAVQLGHNGGLAPMCIGSHYTVRTRALKEIGGLGPELAEDFSTTLLFNSAGWQGAFAIDADARGDGPRTFADMLTQEFQWSRSLTSMLYNLVPRHARRMRRALRLRFLYAVSYYSLLVAMTVAGVVLPPVAAITGQPWIRVNYAGFVAHWWAVSAWLMVLTLMLRNRGLLRPRRAPILSWENWLFAYTRWPYVAWGVLAATVQRLRPRPITFKVTPKARGGLEPLPAALMLPYAAIAVALSAAAVIGEMSTQAVGYVFLCLLGALSYGIVLLAVPALHVAEMARSAGVRAGAALRTARGALAVGTSALVPFGLAAALYPTYAMRVLGW